MTSESPTTSNVAEFSVSEISSSLKRLVEDAFGRVRVRGEISGYRGPHSSGHAYFSLKDEKAKMDAVIWRGAFSKLDFKPEEGLEVIATGKLTTYPGSSKYQIVIDNIEPAGAGALMALLEERRRKLAAEGLFGPERKQLLPFMPRVIGVVTSPTGAVIRDILHRLNDRFPLHVLVWPVRVQGETSADEVATAIRGFNALPDDGPIPRPDLLIVARGGGSLEDLWGFNEEVVVRAAAESFIPLISAVGHETDTTLIDHASDQRAPTPTGAAEMAVPVKADLLAHMAQLSARLSAGVLRVRDRKRDHLRAMQRALPQPDQLMALPRQRFDTVHARMARGLEAGVAAKRGRYQSAAGLLSPARIGNRIAQERRAVSRYHDALPNALKRAVSSSRREFEFRAGRLSPEPIARTARLGRQSVAQSANRAATAFERGVGTARAALDKNARLLATLSYHSVLERGFALVRTADGMPVRHSKSLKTGDALTVQFARDDEIGVIVSGKPPQKPGVSAAPKAPGKKSGAQGTLFDGTD